MHVVISNNQEELGQMFQMHSKNLTVVPVLCGPACMITVGSSSSAYEFVAMYGVVHLESTSLFCFASNSVHLYLDMR